MSCCAHPCMHLLPLTNLAYPIGVISHSSPIPSPPPFTSLSHMFPFSHCLTTSLLPTLPRPRHPAVCPSISHITSSPPSTASIPLISALHHHHQCLHRNI